MGRIEKNSKFRFTAMIGINALGEMAFKKMFVLKNCHRGINWSKMTFHELGNGVQLYVSSTSLYYIQDHAWVNNVIWSDYMKRFNLYLIGQNKNALVILDNFSAHRSNDEYSNIKTAFLKPNLTHSLQPCDLMVISSIKKRFNKWLNHRKLEGQDMTHGEMVKKFGYFQLELEASIGCKAWKKSGLIQDNNYDCEENSDSVREETASDEIVLELYEIPSSSQIVTNQLTELDLNKSQTESLELNETKVLKQTSITSYFCK